MFLKNTWIEVFSLLGRWEPFYMCLMVDFSVFGDNLSSGSGIEELMEDLGHALAYGGDDIKMLGGGQPAMIPEISAVWREHLQRLMEDSGGIERALEKYDPPRGNPQFVEALVKLLREHFGWSVSEKNIAITSGGQTAFFFLFNTLAGRRKDGRFKKILLPLVPEYIGYANQSVDEDFFKAVKPKIEKIGGHQFKYRVDFERLEVDEDIAAICVSRPTNPTGNVLTDEEMSKLADIAKQHDIPLIVDNAYGAPFPNVFFTDVSPIWDEHTILTMSLSKMGLPGTRTGIVVAPESIASAIVSMSAIVGLSNGNVGQSLVEPLIRSGEILDLSQRVVQPFYQKKSLQAQQWVKEFFDAEIPYRVHLSEGALFLWIWFEGLPISVKDLYTLLKNRGVLIVPGSYFFFGMEDKEWKHRDECIRMTFTMEEKVVKGGIQIIGEEIAKLYKKG